MKKRPIVVSWTGSSIAIRTYHGYIWGGLLNRWPDDGFASEIDAAFWEETRLIKKNLA